MNRSIAVLVAAGAAAMASAAPASAVEYVDNDHVQCPTAAHTTIQAGVNAASPNEQVIVCPGTYREQVVIAGPAKNGVDVVSSTTLGATITPPAAPLAAPESLVYINGASGVKVRRFRIAGPGTGTVDSLRHGVLVENNATLADAQILDNVITDIRDSEAAANEEGIGVRVGRAFAGTTGRATILRNEIDDYQKGGVVVDGTGSWGDVSLNTIRGLGLVTSPVTPVPAQQGIQIGRGAAANVNGNHVSGNTYSGPGSAASSFGVLMFNTTTAKDPRAATRISRVTNNTVFGNDIGIYMQDVRNQRIDGNRVNNNGNVSTSADDGGIAVAETSPGAGGGNVLYQNDARGNDGLDCSDGTTGGGTAGTGNTWTLNKGLDAFPATICTP